MMTEKFNIGVHRKIQFLGDGVGVCVGGVCHEKSIGGI